MFSETCGNWVKNAVRVGKTQPINSFREQKLRRTRFTFCYSNCFTMHKIIGETLDKTAIRLSNVRKFKIWELVLLIVEISRVHNLRDSFIVGTKQEARSGLNTLLKIANPNVKKRADRLNTLNALNENDEVSTNIIACNKIFLTIIDVACVLPMRRFIYFSISRVNL